MCDIFKEEFRLANFGLSHNCREDFISCQWNWHPLLFGIYRIITAAYVTVFFITIVIVFSLDGNNDFMAYLTLWTYLLLTLYFLFSAIAVVFYKCTGEGLRRKGHQPTLYTSSKTEKEDINGYNNIAFVESDVKTSKLDGTRISNGFPNETRSYSMTQTDGNESICEDITAFMKICWVLGNVIQVFAIVVTVIYFTALFPLIGHTNFIDVNLHGVNSFLVIIDTCISARPVRLLHLIHPVIYGSVYLTFSGIYWSFDHVNNVLYPGVLDWNYPGTTAIWIVGVTLVVIPLLQLVHFGAYRLKLYICSRAKRTDYDTQSESL